MADIPLRRGFVATVDDEDYQRVSQFKWCAVEVGKSVYATRHDGHTTQYLHRFILKLERGDRRQVDHIDRNGLNNCKSNLRICSSANNKCNRTKYSNNKSGWKGVSRDKRTGKFQAHIQIRDKGIYLGTYHSPITAALEYDKAARTLHGEFACVNFPTS